MPFRTAYSMSRTRALVLLLFLCAWPCAAGMAPIGPEFTVKDGQANNEHNPAIAFTSAGVGVVAWTDSRDGVRMKLLPVALGGVDPDSERLLVENVHLPVIPGHGTEIFNKDPALLVDPEDAAFWLFWTEERQDVTIDFFSEVRVVLDREIRGQRFDLNGQPLGETVRVNNNPDGFQSRPQALALRCDAGETGCTAGSYVVAWESDDLAPQSKPSEGIFARVYDRTGTPLSVQLRLSMPSPAQAVALAAGSGGRFLAVWEAPDKQVRPQLNARFFANTGAALGRPFVVAASAGGVQRRAAVVWNPFNDQAQVFFDRTMPGTGRSRIFMQRITPPGGAVGEPQVLGAGPNDLQAVAVLSGRSTSAVLWTVWKQPYPLAIDGCELDAVGTRLGAGTRIATYPRFSLDLAATPDGLLLAVWEGYVFGGRQGLIGRWMATR